MLRQCPKSTAKHEWAVECERDARNQAQFSLKQSTRLTDNQNGAIERKKKQKNKCPTALESIQTTRIQSRGYERSYPLGHCGGWGGYHRVSR